MVLAMTAAIPALAAAFDVPAGRVAQVTAVFSTLAAVLTAAINAAEDKGLIPALLKAPASSGTNPMPNDAS
jgi:hypothetical protein